MERIFLPTPDSSPETVTQMTAEQVNAMKKGILIAFLVLWCYRRCPRCASGQHYGRWTHGCGRVGETQRFFHIIIPNMDTHHLDSNAFFLSISCLSVWFWFCFLKLQDSGFQLELVITGLRFLNATQQEKLLLILEE